MQPIPQEEHQDVLHAIEESVVQVYHAHPDLTDFQVDSAMEALIRTYAREKSSPPPGGTAETSLVLPKGDLPREVFQSMKTVCDWRLGRQNAVDENEQPIRIEPLSVEEMQACLKRLRKSLNTWNKRSGTRGYLNYINQFLPR